MCVLVTKNGLVNHTQIKLGQPTLLEWSSYMLNSYESLGYIYMYKIYIQRTNLKKTFLETKYSQYCVFNVLFCKLVVISYFLTVTFIGSLSFIIGIFILQIISSANIWEQ